MSSSPSLSASPSDAPPLETASALLARLLQPDTALRGRLAEAYGPDSEVIRERLAAAARTVERFLATHGDRPCALYRAPSRISLNPHCDHQGAWVPYGLHIRELLAVIAPADDDRVEVTNTDPEFAPCLSFSLSEEIARDRDAWDEDWFRYIEAPAVVAETRRNLDAKGARKERRGTLNYLKAGLLRMRHAYPDAPLPGLRITLNGNIPQGGGQSSSSTLVVTAALAALDLTGLPVDRRLLAEQCGEAEWYVGTRGGSGDHAAILLGAREGLTHLCFRAPFGVRGVQHSAFPSGYQLILANSQTRSEKSAEERLMFNRGIFAYRFAFLALKEEMTALGLPPDVVAETASLGDLHTGRIAPADLYRLLLRLPEWVSAAALAARFPAAFSAAARGCFGTDDLSALPTEIPLRGAAVYGLGRVDRGRAMPELLEAGDDLSMSLFGWLMSITHDGDRLHRGAEPYTEHQERLADSRLLRLQSEVEAGEERPLRMEPGFYGASIRELDHMVDLALRTDGVLGAGLMGAGGGGYVLILAREGSLEGVREALVQGYYRPEGKEPEVEAWQPTAAACRLV